MLFITISIILNTFSTTYIIKSRFTRAFKRLSPYIYQTWFVFSFQIKKPFYLIKIINFDIQNMDKVLTCTIIIYNSFLRGDPSAPQRLFYAFVEEHIHGQSHSRFLYNFSLKSKNVSWGAQKQFYSKQLVLLFLHFVSRNPGINVH